MCVCMRACVCVYLRVCVHVCVCVCTRALNFHFTYLLNETYS